jgi:Excreted virulence factor EspC, type VII ESX diderm
VGKSAGTPWVFVPFGAAPGGVNLTLGPLQTDRMGAHEMSAGGNFQVDPQAMATVLTGISGLLGQLQGAVGDAGGLAVPAGSFGGLGTSVAGTAGTLQAQSSAALGALHAALAELHRRLNSSLDGYQQADRDVAAALLALTPSQSIPAIGR